MKPAIYGGLVGFALGAVALVTGLAVFAPQDSPSLWQLSRLAGLVAYTWLWGSVIWGLVLSSRLAGGGTLGRPAQQLEAHQYLGQLALGFALFHSLALAGDRHLGLPLGSLLLPLGSASALLVLGQLSLWITALLLLSQRLRRILGNQWWRRLHYGAYLAYAAACAHAIGLGTSSREPEVQAFYLFTAGLVVLLTLYRILVREPVRSGRILRSGSAHGTRMHPAGGG